MERPVRKKTRPNRLKYKKFPVYGGESGEIFYKIISNSMNQDNFSIENYNRPINNFLIQALFLINTLFIKTLKKITD